MATQSKRRKAGASTGGAATGGQRKILSVPLPAGVVDRLWRLARVHGMTPGAVGRHLLIPALEMAEREGLRLAVVEPVAVSA